MICRFLLSQLFLEGLSFGSGFLNSSICAVSFVGFEYVICIDCCYIVFQGDRTSIMSPAEPNLLNPSLSKLPSNIPAALFSAPQGKAFFLHGAGITENNFYLFGLSIRQLLADACLTTDGTKPVCIQMIVGNSSRSKPVSTSPGWQTSTFLPSRSLLLI